MKKENQIKTIKQKFAKDYPELELDTVDFDAMIDSTLSLKENCEQMIKTHGLGKIPKTKEKEIEKENKRKEEEHKTEIMKIQETQAHRDLELALATIKDTKTSVLEVYFTIPKSLIITWLKNKDVHGIILEGEAGIGKSYIVQQTLAENNYKLGKNFEIISGYITPLELYRTLYENKDNVIVFDDIAKIFENELNKGLLLSALWNPSGTRKVDYRSSTSKLEDVPREFIFNGKICWCLNSLSKDMGALKSRVYFYKFSFTWADRLAIMYEIAKVSGIPQEMIDFIRDNTNEAYQIDFRLPIKVYNVYKTHKKNWQKIAKSLLTTTTEPEMLVIYNLLAHSSTVSQMVTEFTRETGMSRATFYRYKKRIQTQVKLEKAVFEILQEKSLNIS